MSRYGTPQDDSPDMLFKKLHQGKKDSGDHPYNGGHRRGLRTDLALHEVQVAAHSRCCRRRESPACDSRRICQPSCFALPTRNWDRRLCTIARSAENVLAPNDSLNASWSWRPRGHSRKPAIEVHNELFEDCHATEKPARLIEGLTTQATVTHCAQQRRSHPESPCTGHP